MRFCVLGSGSKGNATYIEAGETRLLIDAGFSGVEIGRRLTVIGVEADDLSAILITHEHTDHIKGAPVLSRKLGIPVYVNQATYEAAGWDTKKIYKWHPIEAGASFAIGSLTIHPFSVSHDAADPMGYVIKNSTVSIGYCTDTGVASRLMHHRLAGCHALILESNHDPEMLRNGAYPLYLQQRIRSKAGHLANGQAAEFLRDLLHDDLQHVVLAHLSDSNNTPDLVRREFELLMQSCEDLCRRGSPCISISCQDKTGEMIDLRDT